MPETPGYAPDLTTAREFWGQDDNGRPMLLAITHVGADAGVVWIALIAARAYVEERTHEVHRYKGRFIRSWFEEEEPKVKYASDLEAEGIVP